MILKSILFRLIIFAKERCGCEYEQDKQKEFKRIRNGIYDKKIIKVVYL